ncbi:Panacea domain-containing protein [Flavobacterium sp. ARAG 55.4]|uniref:Panacea domain-containing protein n=1 Tax=Flavobacterium sp. ARAG 55.4 TaxID=3451357 RepID=UPI003F4731DA
MNQIKEIQITNAQLLADFILQEYGSMSHLKLQKLIYYCDAYHLAYFDNQLVEQQFEAWVHGPVCREVYNNLKDTSLLYSDISIDLKGSKYDPKNELTKIITSNQFELIKDVLDELTTWTGLELEDATHNELPWIEARKGFSPAERCTNEISKETMRVFYKEEINA